MLKKFTQFKYFAGSPTPLGTDGKTVFDNVNEWLSEIADECGKEYKDMKINYDCDGKYANIVVIYEVTELTHE